MKTTKRYFLFRQAGTIRKVSKNYIGAVCVLADSFEAACLKYDEVLNS